MADFWELYKDYENERLRKKAAKDHYRHVLKTMEQYVEKDFFQVTPDDADIYAAQYETGDLVKPLTTTGDVRIRILKSVGTYMEVKNPGYISPFTHLAVNKREKYQRSDLVDAKTVDLVLAEAKRTGNLRAFLAISLALKMCLSTAELLKLKRSHFFKDENLKLYLFVPATEEYKERIIVVEENIQDLIRECRPGFFSSKDDEYLICNEKTKSPISSTALRKSITAASDPVKKGELVTLQNVRKLGIALLAQEHNDLRDVVKYSGIHENLAYLYEGFKNKKIELPHMTHITIQLNESDN